MQCAYQGCMSAYEQPSSNFQYCYDYVNGFEGTLWSVKREATIMRNWGCWGWMDMPIKWNQNLVLSGGYRSANFDTCQGTLDRGYYNCRMIKEDSDSAYSECGTNVCRAREGAEEYLEFASECQYVIMNNIDILNGEDGKLAYEQGQTVGCEICNNDGTCDEHESYAECSNDCNKCVEDGICDERTESHENCPNDCICVQDGVCDTAAGENIHTCPGDCPAGCNGNSICELDQGEDENTCPQDCSGSDSGGGGGSNAIGCGGNLCSEGILTCCSYYGNQVCANSDGSCPQEGNQCGGGYCNLGESCCSGSVCSTNGICPDSGGGGGCNNNGICDNGENADFCSSDCGCNYDGTCQSERGETVDTCGNDCGCNSNAICEPGRGEAYGNCEDCSGNSGGNNLCPGGWMGPYGACEYPQPGSHCESDLQGSYWTGAECACPSPLQNLGNGRCEDGPGGGGSTQCNSNGICEEGENQEGCPSDCPYGCNNNGKCETANGEDEYNCQTDCKSFSGGGEEDYSTSIWTSSLNRELQLQKGYGYNANWEPCYQNMENCWSYCGYEKNSCIQTNYPECAQSKCVVYSDSIQTGCIDELMRIASKLEISEQAQEAFYNAQSRCNPNVRRLAKAKPHGHLRK